MSTAILIFAFIAVVQFVYESIVAPSWRMKLRNELFVLRDEVREEKIRGVSKADDEAFWFVHNGVNSFLSKLPSLTAWNQHLALEVLRADPELRAVVNKRIATIDQCTNDVVKSVFRRTVKVVEEAMVVNAGGWFVYLIPVALLMATLGRLKRFASALVVAPEREAARLLPQQA